MKKKKAITLDEFQVWLDSLSELDRANFATLIGLPQALELVAQMPEGQYRDMTVFGLAIRKALESVE